MARPIKKKLLYCTEKTLVDLRSALLYYDINDMVG